jgi:hypothetical protein
LIVTRDRMERFARLADLRTIYIDRFPANIAYIRAQISKSSLPCPGTPNGARGRWGTSTCSPNTGLSTLISPEPLSLQRENGLKRFFLLLRAQD